MRLNTKINQAEWVWYEYEAENVVIVRLNGRLNEKLKCEAKMLCQIVRLNECESE